MRALLVGNPQATATSPRVQDVIAKALAAELQLDVAQTEYRGHAIELGAKATAQQYDYVIVVGGDGTVNEVVNGLLEAHPAQRIPTIGVVPGGSANVFARSLGLSNDPVEATGQLLEALQARRSRSISLGRVDGRWFVFTAGFGFDAEVVHQVELRRATGSKATPHLYARTAVAHFYRSALRRQPPITLQVPGNEPIEGLFLCVVSNSTPWTYFKARPVEVSPRASFDTGLEIFAMRKARTLAALRTMWQVTHTHSQPGGHRAATFHDLSDFTLHARVPIELQVDGDFAGLHTSVRFHSVPNAISALV